MPEMSTSMLRRSFAAASIVTVGLAAGPAVGVAFATGSQVSPVFADANTAFATADGAATFAGVLNNAGQRVELPTAGSVEFDGPVAVTYNDCASDPTTGAPLNQACDPSGPGGATFGDSVQTVPGNYLHPATGSDIPLTATKDGTDANRLDLAVPNGTSIPDGVYTLHVEVCSGSCPDVDDGGADGAGYQPGAGSYNDFVDKPSTSTPFAFRVDSTPPTLTIDNTVPSTVDSSNVKSVPISGTTSADTKTVTVDIKSSAGGATRHYSISMPEALNNSAQAWSVSGGADLSQLLDGTLTITADGTDLAAPVGNKSSHGHGEATATSTLAAHASAPKSVTAKAGDSNATVRWARPSKNGGSTITGYKIVANDTTTKVSNTPVKVGCSGKCPTISKKVVKGLTNGDAYTFTVRAVTAAGPGAPGTSSAVTPIGHTSLTAKGNRSKIVYGHTVRLSGRLIDNGNGAGVKGRLTITPIFGKGKTGKPVKVMTDVFGLWHKRLVVRRSTRWRVSYPGTKGEKSARAYTSTRALANITRKRLKSSTVGKTVRLSGHVSPNESGHTVTVYRLLANGHKVKVGSGKLSKKSTWSITINVARGTHSYVAVVGKAKTVLGNHTRKFKLTRK
jgi:hypothetical protein